MPNNFASSPFDAIRRLDQNGNEYWAAKELEKVFTYNNQFCCLPPHQEFIFTHYAYLFPNMIHLLY